MKYSEHYRILGILYLVFGIFNLLGLIFGFTVLSALIPIWDIPVEVQAAFQIGKYIIGVLVFLLAVPSIIGGISLLQKKEWPMLLLLIIGCFYLFWFPLGTLLGVYTLIVYVSKSREQQDKKPDSSFE
jgi:hypothetical protein